MPSAQALAVGLDRLLLRFRIEREEIAGDAASIHCSTAKRTRDRVFSSACSDSTMPSRVRAFSRYISAR